MNLYTTYTSTAVKTFFLYSTQVNLYTIPNMSELYGALIKYKMHYTLHRERERERERVLDAVGHDIIEQFE